MASDLTEALRACGRAWKSDCALIRHPALCEIVSCLEEFIGDLAVQMHAAGRVAYDIKLCAVLDAIDTASGLDRNGLDFLLCPCWLDLSAGETLCSLLAGTASF